LHIVTQYRLTFAGKVAILAADGGICVICREPADMLVEMVVDHDHSCCASRFTCGNCIRGILHPRCNVFLGQAEALGFTHPYLVNAPDRMRRNAALREAHFFTRLPVSVAPELQAMNIVVPGATAKPSRFGGPRQPRTGDKEPMRDDMRPVNFFDGPRNKQKILHVETDGCTVNIQVGLHDAAGRLVTSVLVSPDDASRGGDGDGHVWVQDGSRIVRLHEGETALPEPNGDNTALDEIAELFRNPRDPETMLEIISAAVGRTGRLAGTSYHH
jgi:hypothetical protein